jgi:hypothetical protein
MTNTSFYKGNVVKLTPGNPTEWNVAQVYFLDTNCDDNIHTNFIHKTETRAAIIPAEIIKNFDPATTQKVKRWFDTETGTEHWESMI